MLKWVSYILYSCVLITFGLSHYQVCTVLWAVTNLVILTFVCPTDMNMYRCRVAFLTSGVRASSMTTSVVIK